MVYKWYILPIGGLYILYATYQHLGEPEKTIEEMINMALKNTGKFIHFGSYDAYQ